MTKALSFLILFTLLVNILFSQQSQYHYGIEDGLVSDNVYTATQDSKGYLWFGTYHGVSRFDGKVFQNFSMKDGLLNNDVFVIKEDYKGRIWFGSYTNGLCYFYNDRIYPFKFNDELMNAVKAKSAKMSLRIEENEVVYIGDAVQGLIRIDSAGNVDILGEHKRNVFDFGDEILTSHKKRRVKGNTKSKGFNIINYHDKILLSESFKKKIDIDNRMNTTGSHYVVKYGLDTILLVQGNMFLKYINGSFQEELLTYRSEDLYIDAKNRIWIGTWYEGVYCYDDYNLQNTVFHDLQGQTVTHITEDFQGGFWFTTLENGIFHYPALLIDEGPASLPKKKIRDVIKGPDNSLFVHFDDAEVWYVQNQEAERISTFNERLNRETNHIYYESSTNTLFVKGELNSNKNWGFKISKIPLFRKAFPPAISYSMFKLKNDLYDIRGRGIYLYEDGDVTYSFGSELEYNRIQSKLERSDTVWLGTLHGIYYVTGKEVHEYKGLNSQSKITAITGNEKIIAFAVEGYGIMVRSSKGVSWIQDIDSYNSLKVFDLDIDESGNILIATTKGLYYAKENNALWKVRKISSQQADIKGAIYRVMIEGRKLFLGGDNGLIILDLDILNQEIIPSKAFIELSKINGQPVAFTSNGILNYDQNSLELNFRSIDFTENIDPVYSWKIDRKNEIWHESKNSSLYLDKLSPGKYTIIMRAAAVPGVWSEENELEFTVKAPFWQRWYFITFSSLLSIGIVVLIFYKKGQKIRKEAEQEVRLMKEKNELEMRALRAQMNPHFIFNTLAAIQYLIQSNNNKRAQHFLLKFSKLLRRVTDTSQDRRITLKEELEILSTYVEIQNLRFKDKFQYTLNISEDLQIEKILIPGFILQPFVENAIQHGLSKKDGIGKLQIDIKRNNGKLHFSIKDNGIGRRNSKKLKLDSDSEKRSIGISNVSDRLNIINHENKESSGSVDVIDLYDDRNEACGTKVNLNVKFEEV